LRADVFGHRAMALDRPRRYVQSEGETLPVGARSKACLVQQRLGAVHVVLEVGHVSRVERVAPMQRPGGGLGTSPEQNLGNEVGVQRVSQRLTHAQIIERLAA